MTLLPINEKETTVLVELGLTASEAKVYLALIQIGTAQIGSISKATGIHREHLYQIVHSLEKKGLIEKELGLVSKYKAATLDEILPMLVKRKQAEISELTTKADILAEDFKKRKQLITSTLNDLPEENAQFYIIPGKKVIILRLQEAIHKSQNSIDVVTPWKRFSPTIMEFYEEYKKALCRGVKIRISTENPPSKKMHPENVQTLMKNPNFEVKYSVTPEAAVSIFDKKQAMFTMSTTTDLMGTSTLWSNNGCFIALAQNYFDTKWNSSQKEPQTSLKNIISEKPRSNAHRIKKQTTTLDGPS